MYRCELDHKEGCTLRIWSFQTAVLEKTPDSPLDSKEIKPVNPKGNQPWIFIGRTDDESSNTLAIWLEESTHWKRLWCWERLRAGGELGDRGWDGWMASPTQWMLSLSKLREIVKDRGAWPAAVYAVGKSRTWLSNRRTTTNKVKVKTTSLLWIDYLTV